MKIGYPCINRSIGCTANSTFRLASYSRENLISKVENNLSCLRKILEFNVRHGLLFFRISSDLVPFASHPICRFDWLNHFKTEFKEIGAFIRKNDLRISMHPDQFVLINAKESDIVKRSIKELEYHCDLLDALGLDKTARVQIHVGGVYGDKDKSMQRFIREYGKLGMKIKKRLVIENDDKLYSVKDCLAISNETGIPVLFDNFHHQCLNHGETNREALIIAKNTWKNSDGPLMVDYSSQKKGTRKGTHTEHITMRLFRQFLAETAGLDFDIMLEIKDKEKSALKVIKALN
ncbi:MAG: UV DNA damage repair endonuclease UvsE [Candidatus Brocadia sp.]|nr:MAG: UV DNA damage repair endonuclease UvsE [Candidatus Brocadia sp.]